MNKWLITLLLAPWLLIQAHAADLAAMEEEAAAARAEMADAAQRLAEAERRLAELRGERIGRVFFQRAPAMAFGGLADDTRYSILFHPGPGPDDRRSWIGVVLGDDDPAGGVTVMGLTPGGPARKAGLQRGDVIRAVNGQVLGASGAAELRELLQDIEPGAEVMIAVDRDGERLELPVETTTPGRQLGIELEKIRELVEDGLAGHRTRIMQRSEGFPIDVFELPGAEVVLRPGMILGRGADLVANHPGLAPYFGTGDGVLVVRIADDNPLGLKPGDVILRINEEEVTRPVDVGRNLMRLEPGTEITLDIIREGRDQRLEGRTPDRRLGWRWTFRE